MEKINYRIQRNNNLNNVYVSNEPEDLHNGVPHLYHIECGTKEDPVSTTIMFQKGPRKDPNSTRGVTAEDLLEIVRDRLQGHQNTEYRTRENACALTHIEEALMWLAKRSDDRAERGVLGTMEK
jgi:hypothetical protein